ncbi:MAG TPA: amidohydrolase family protein [Streptosporangiaceae bacterium]|nr:amidohydrolase family protein [Streptosporangiaceae bacterium]
MNAAEITQLADTVPLVDHHCHGLVRTPVTAGVFEDLATESDAGQPAGFTVFDSPLGVAIRAECGPLLGLPRHAAPAGYLAARSALGDAESARRLLSGTGISRYIVETGYRSGDILSPEETAALGGGASSQVVRLEVVAEQLAAAGTGAAEFGARYAEALAAAAAPAVGLKSVIAYRFGLDFDPAPPSRAEVTAAAGEWLAAGPADPAAGRWRLDHPVLLRAVLWAGVALAKPLQFHVGYGDSDIVLHRCDPARMTAFLHATVSSGCPVMLLHCYPFIREAGYLAQVYPHVYLDTGAAVHFTGASSRALIAQSLEVAPFAKLLFSSDAFGLAELYYCGALLWRRGIGAILRDWVGRDEISGADAARYLHAIAHGNAERVYGVAA